MTDAEGSDCDLSAWRGEAGLSETETNGDKRPRGKSSTEPDGEVRREAGARDRERNALRGLDGMHSLRAACTGT